ncbi:annexin ANXC4 [Talaromyces stipitatus ATCC 10500]|uniref:Annexin ANXC4 n=1 Tax=Talaromyces stipitatus (strain ATCC 10500 / CBS 375.48 / QM 6759 / NRRL 1006) TaxID=441959 RepID=B8MMK5_TALSN|nr:annexin ANXC4 [Talaromyces stipitatus ATCC 10500]EED13759.1 annexin ANXC4 [Talaromyces stipitatus ATCC 10500]
MATTPEPDLPSTSLATASEANHNSTRLTRDDRIRVLTLRDAGLTYSQISSQLQISYRQVQYTCQSQQTTPKKARGQIPKLSETDVDKIIEWISSSKRTRRMPYYKVVQELELPVGTAALSRALKKRGYTRCKALAKSPLSDQHKRVRLAWALEHINWTVEQWNRILWTDETWVTPGFHTRIWVTRKAGEELDETCLRTAHPRERGWMFWASFHGDAKGPCLFWEKEWGTIGSESYRERIVPIIDGYTRLMNRQPSTFLQLMQDGTPGHASKDTIEELQSRNIYPIFWPAFSPDLNPIEAVWNWMKDWIQEQYPEEETLSYDRLREVVRASWDALPEQFLKDLIDSMQARCQAVIDAAVTHSPWSEWFHSVCTERIFQPISGHQPERPYGGAAPLKTAKVLAGRGLIVNGTRSSYWPMNILRCKSGTSRARHLVKSREFRLQLKLKSKTPLCCTLAWIRSRLKISEIVHVHSTSKRSTFAWSLKSPSGRTRDRSQSRDVRTASRSPAPTPRTVSTSKKYYDSDSAEEGRRNKRSEYSSHSSRSDKRSSKYDDLTDSEEEYMAKERAKDRYYHSDSEDDRSKISSTKRGLQDKVSEYTSSKTSSRYKNEAEKDRAYRNSGHGRSHSSAYHSDSETGSDSDLSALAYGDAPNHMKPQLYQSAQDPRSSRESISSKLASKLAGASYRLDDSAHDRPGSHPSYAKPDQFAYQQPNAPVHAQPGQYADPRIQAQINSGQIPPMLPPNWAPIPPSEMPGYVPPGAHPQTTQSIPGAFPGGYPATSGPPPTTHYPQSQGYTATQSYAAPGQYQYANPDPNIRYTSKTNDRQAYTATAQNQFATNKPSYTASNEPQFLDIAPGRSRAESVGRQGRPHSLSVSSNLSVGGGMSAAGGRPPASPLLEAYKGTYQSISPMPSPIARPVGLARDSDISDLEELGGSSGSDRRRKYKYSRSRDERKEKEREKERETEKEKDRRRHSRHSSSHAGGEEIITITPGSSRKKVLFYEPEDDAIALKDALSRHSGIDTRPLMEILPNLSSDQILALRAEYKKHAKVHNKGINIAKHIKLKLGNTSFGKVCYATALGRWESEAYWANCYYQAGTSRRELLIESLIGRSNAEIREIKSCFRDARYSDSLEKCMKSELKADKFRYAILLALSEQRQSSKEQVSSREVQEDVVALRRAVTAREGGETAMIDIVLLRNDAHLREIMRVYDHAYKSNFAKDVIKKSQNLVGETLVHVLNGAVNRPMRDALLLHQAIRESHSSKERSELLISRLVRLHWEPKHLELVKEEYRYRYKERVEEAIAQEVITSSGGSEWGEFCIELARSSSKMA